MFFVNLLIYRHDKISELLRQREASMVMKGNDAGVWMCQVDLMNSEVSVNFDLNYKVSSTSHPDRVTGIALMVSFMFLCN